VCGTQKNLKNVIIKQTSFQLPVPSINVLPFMNEENNKKEVV
jgi:hypothetical protein